MVTLIVPLWVDVKTFKKTICKTEMQAMCNIPATLSSILGTPIIPVGVPCTQKKNKYSKDFVDSILNHSNVE